MPTRLGAITPSNDPVQGDDERHVVRRGVLLMGVLGLLTAPLANFGLLREQTWVLPVNAMLLLLMLAAASGGVLLARAIAVTSAGLYVVALLSWHHTLGVVLQGGEPVMAVGTGALWVAATMSPMCFLIMQPRRAGVLHAAGLTAFVLLPLFSRGPRGWSAAVDHGALLVVVYAIACVLTSAAVAAHVRRPRRQLESTQRAADATRVRVSALAEEQSARREAFLHTARGLLVETASLAGQVDAVASSGPLQLDSPSTQAKLDAISTTVERLEAVAGQTLAQRHTPLSSDNKGVAVTQATPTASSGASVALVLVLLAWVTDLATLLALLVGRAPSTGLLSAGQRMVVLLVAIAGTATIRLPRRKATWLVVVTCASYPLSLLATRPADAVQVIRLLGPGWRIAVLSTGLLIFMGLIMQERERTRDAARDSHHALIDVEQSLMMAEARQHQDSAEAAHELQTPLTVLHGTLATLARAPDRLSPTMVAQLLEGLVRSAHRLSARADALLAAANEVQDHHSADGGASGQPLPATSTLLEAIRAAEPVLGGRRLVVDLHLGDDAVAVEIGALEHVLENLFSNARKYGAEDGAVAVQASRKGGHVIVAVANDGVGLTPEEATQLFDPYFRGTGAEAKAAGTGLGLTVVRRIVEGWRGEIRCEVGEGRTVLTFTIPVVPVVVRPAVV